MNKHAKAAAEDAAIVALHMMATGRAQTMRGPAQIARAAVELCDIAAKLQTIHVDDCNYPDEGGRRERRHKRLVERASAIALTEACMTIRVQSDPRGWPLYLAKDGQDVCGLSGRYGNRY